MSPQLEVRRLGWALGALVTGVDVSRPLEAATIAKILELWLEHHVLCFPNQHLGPEELLEFTKIFGSVDDNRTIHEARLPGFNEVTRLRHEPAARHRPFGGGRNWHSDLQYTQRPAVGTFLWNMELPSVGSDTLFANMHMAYESLSPTLQAILDPLEGVHDATMQKGFRNRTAESAAEFIRLNPPVVHPIVRIHPETGRKALFVNDRVRQFVGMTEDESRPFLEFLTRHAVFHEFVYRHRWTLNDLLMWDNRSLNHVALTDFDPAEARYMLRCTLLGAKTGRLYAPELEAATAP